MMHKFAEVFADIALAGGVLGAFSEKREKGKEVPYLSQLNDGYEGISIKLSEEEKALLRRRHDAYDACAGEEIDWRKTMDKVTDAKIEAAAKAIRDLYESLSAPEDAIPRQIARVALEAAAKVEG